MPIVRLENEALERIVQRSAGLCDIRRIRWACFGRVMHGFRFGVERGNHRVIRDNSITIGVFHQVDQ